MSDDFIILVPRDPQSAASLDVQVRVVALLKRIAPSAESITPEVSEAIRFHDAGENLERIICPRCGEEISIDWWSDRMDEDSTDNGFRLGSYAAPCCNKLVTLNELIYDWPLGIRWQWSVTYCSACASQTVWPPQFGSSAIWSTT